MGYEGWIFDTHEEDAEMGLGLGFSFEQGLGPCPGFAGPGPAPAQPCMPADFSGGWITHMDPAPAAEDHCTINPQYLDLHDHPAFEAGLLGQCLLNTAPRSLPLSPVSTLDHAYQPALQLSGAGTAQHVDHSPFNAEHAYYPAGASVPGDYLVEVALPRVSHALEE